MPTREPTEGSSDDEGGDNRATDLFGAPRLSDVLNYRKVAIAVVASYVGLDDGFVDAVLADQMDEYEQAHERERERLKTERYDEYLHLLGREMLVRYAATAAESLASDPERIAPPAPTLAHDDDQAAVIRVHEIFEFLESPDAEAVSEKHLFAAKRHLCRYYAASAATLVRQSLLPVIITAADELCYKGTLSAERTRELIIASQNKK